MCRLGFIVDFLSHATIVGFMAGAATVVCLQQLKGMLGLEHFTTATDLVSVLKSVFTQVHQVHSLPRPAGGRGFFLSLQWRWESAVLGCCFLFFLLLTRFFVSNHSYVTLCPFDFCDTGNPVGVPHSCRKPWSPSGEPSISDLNHPSGPYCSTVFNPTMAPNLQIGYLKKGLNPPSMTSLIFTTPYLTVALKTGVVTGIVALAVGLLLLADR
ncbi:hypothetical protein BHE74_00015162 [Ensete ventricosum]|nr:hypothetical protein GW17_00054246 [Ensete ventricosum]RWW76724.1 hypothetical protein BHE74_00015162 [Ensete ventricosum]RZS09902.1 hypothetical protein BHM03_00041032 [Ensete ventricosum]